MKAEELRETAKQFRLTAQSIYDREQSESYHTALNHIYEATRRELYAGMIEGREKDLQRCIELNKGESDRAKERTRAATSSTEELVRDVRGRYNLFSTPYAERKEESERQKHRAREKEKAKESEREEKDRGFKALPSQFTFKM